MIGPFCPGLGLIPRRGLNLLIFIVLVYCATSTSLFAAKPVNQPFTFSWDSIKGAGGYLIEIRDSVGDVVFTEKVPAGVDKRTVSLPPGPYQIRVTTLNRFMRTEGSSEWIAVQIDAPSPPIFISIKPNSIQTGASQSISVQADNLAADASAQILSPSDQPVPLKIRRINDSDLELFLPALQESGDYTLVVTNPPDLATVVKGVLQVKVPPAFITNISPDTIPTDQDMATMQLYGNNFSDSVKVFLRDELHGQEIPLAVVSTTPQQVIASLPPGLVPGRYIVSLINEPGQAAINPPEQYLHIVLPPALLVTAPPIEVATVELRQPAPIKKVPASPVLLTAGWFVMIPLDEWAKIYDASAGNAFLRGDFFFVPLNRPKVGSSLAFAIGGDARFMTFQNPGSSTIVESSLTNLMVTIDPSLVWSLPFMSVTLRAGGGGTYSNFQSSSTNGEPLILQSLDPVLLAELDLEFPVFALFRLGVAANYTHIFYTTDANYLGFSAFASFLF